jgi:TolA-binding protein
MARPLPKTTTNPAHSGPRRGRGAIWPLLLLAALALPGLGACMPGGEARQLAEKGRALWEDGRYQDAARNFVTLAELYPGSPLAEQALFWAASLYQHYLDDPEQASRHYQHLTVSYPRGRYFYQARQSLAEVYEQKPESRHRALQIHQQLLLAEEMAGQRDVLRLKIGHLNLLMGKMDQARLELRDLLVESTDAELRAQASYLVAYTYYLERRYDLALYAFRETAKAFAGTPIAVRAQYFVADTLEEQGQMREALRAYSSLKDTHPNPEIVELRIKTLQARMRRGVR